MESRPLQSPPSGDLVFRGRKEVVIAEGGHDFRQLETGDGRQVFLHGSVIGEDLAAFARRRDFSDAAGRFIVLVHDAEAAKLSIHTDRYGVVPFYRASSSERLVLSTRLRPLLRSRVVGGELDLDALSDFLCFQFVFDARTLVVGVEDVAPGRHLVDLDSLAVSHERAWRPEVLLREPGRPYEQAAGELIESFLDATRRCTEGAPHVAVTLSGGMDTRCLLAAALHLGRPTSACQVAVPGSRAERYAARIAEVCQVPLRAHALDAGFASLYYGLIRRVVDASEGMKFVPQPEMLWLRDRVETPAWVLHGAFGEIAKLRVLRDFRVDAAAEGLAPSGLESLLWGRFEDRWTSNLRIFSAEMRARLAPLPRGHLRSAVGRLDPGLSVPEQLQVLYFREFVKSARYGHQIWNRRMPTHFPFLDPAFVDRVLRVRSEDRFEQRFQLDFLRAIDPRLHSLPDENTGASAQAPRLWGRAVRAMDLVRLVLFDSKVEANHGDLVTWIHGMEPPIVEILRESGDDPIYDRLALTEMLAGVRRTLARPGPARALSLRRARRDAANLQTFLLVAAFRGWLREARGS